MKRISALFLIALTLLSVIPAVHASADVITIDLNYSNVGGRADISHFKDRAKIDCWAYEAVSWAASFGIMAGNDDGSFAPLNPVKRCEAAQVFYKVNIIFHG
ncbi:MAG: S-layer homology domain-containing protein [Clostridia bacterium]|nr:S-layer homology domain-containing protein [Clostridia bacterium]